jgi:hypothetical protein
MTCEICGHSFYDHGEYAWLPRPTHPQAKLTRVSDRCDATIYQSVSGDDLGRKCGCVRFELQNKQDRLADLETDADLTKGDR